MRILFVYGNGDYSALDYERDIGQEKALKLIGGELNKEVEIGPDTRAKLIDVGEVSAEFIQFIRDEIQNYDQAKARNFYIIE